MTEPTPKSHRIRRSFRFRLSLLFLLTAIVSIPIAFLANAKRSFDQETNNLYDLTIKLERPLQKPMDSEDDNYGVLAVLTSRVYWKWSNIGKLTRIPFLRRVTTIVLHARECDSKIPVEIGLFDELESLVLRGKFDDAVVNSFVNTHPEVQVRRME